MYLLFVYKNTPKRKKAKREYILYSLTLGSLFCFVCKLFSETKESGLVSKNGFSDWRNTNRVDQHGNSNAHKSCVLTYITRKSEINISDSIVKQVQSEISYWRNVLKRVISTTRLLAERGLSFRGSDEKFGSLSNGNFLGVIELLSEYNQFLAAHIY